MNKRQTCAVVFSPDLSLLVLLKQPLTDSSVKVVGTGSATSLPDLIRQERPNVIVCDIEGTPQSAIESISLPLKESDADVVLVDAKPLAEQWRQLLGARLDYVPKPIRLDHYGSVISRIVVNMSSPAPIQLELIADLQAFSQLVVASPQMQRVVDFAKKHARSRLPIMIFANPGTEVEDVARTIHLYSHGRTDSFRGIYCASLPDSIEESVIFGHTRERAKGQDQPATIYLHNIHDMPKDLQGRLMRMLKAHRFVDLLDPNNPAPRFLSSIDCHAEQAISQGILRADVFHMLNVLSLSILPLSERSEDIIPLIADRYRRLLNGKQPLPHIPDDIVGLLTEYPWPGNTIELENFVASTLLSLNKTTVTYLDLPDSILRHFKLFLRAISSAASGLPEGKFEPLAIFEARVERNYILAVLRVLKGNKEATAARLGISLATVYRKLPNVNHVDEAHNIEYVTLPEEIIHLKDYVQQQKESYFLRVLETVQQDKAKAADILGISVASLYRFLSQSSAPSCS